MAGDWIDRIVKAAGALGLNEVRVRWKLQNLQARRQKAAREREQRREHIRYEHKICEHCGSVQDKGARECSRCGEKLGSRRWQVLRRAGLSMPQAASVSAVLAVAMVAIYLRTVFAAGGGFFSIHPDVLVELGGRWPPAIAAGEWWRLGTSIFLHAGLWHIGFNLLALSIIGPHVEEQYGRLSTLFLFMATGLLANVGSLMVGPLGVGIGASGAIMGLVGIAAGRGQRLGTTAGRELRNDMLKWSAYVFFFGFLIGADNWAHLFGLLVGGAVGLALDPDLLRRPAMRPITLLAGGLGIAAAAGSIALIFVSPVL